MQDEVIHIQDKQAICQKQAEANKQSLILELSLFLCCAAACVLCSRNIATGIYWPTFMSKHRSFATCLIWHSIFYCKQYGTPVYFAHIVLREKQYCISVSSCCIMSCIWRTTQCVILFTVNMFVLGEYHITRLVCGHITIIHDFTRRR